MGKTITICFTNNKGGSISVYERDGKYQIYAKEITKEGAGLLYEKYLALKAELEEMGMFAPEYKQPIPAYVKKIGVVTAPTGAAVQDIKNIALRRNPFVQIILYPALVQGEGAADSIVEGIRRLDALNLDVLIVGRGGGSIEDLWAFNEEKVARAVFSCHTPVISAVGHETDTTIIDFVADLRASTPSAAAELAVADVRAVLNTLENYKSRMNHAMANQTQRARSRLLQYETKWKYLGPENKIRDQSTPRRAGASVYRCDGRKAQRSAPPPCPLHSGDEGSVPAGQAEPGLFLRGKRRKSHHFGAGCQRR